MLKNPAPDALDNLRDAAFSFADIAQNLSEKLLEPRTAYQIAIAIESTFATGRHRTGKTKGCLSRLTGLAMAFKLMMAAQNKWRKLDGANRMPEIIEGIAFKDGIKQLNQAA